MNSQKGIQGFTRKYQYLGETKHIRVPASIADKIQYQLELLEKVASKKDITKVNQVLDNFNQEIRSQFGL